jgi:hypothetical protein
MAGPRQLVSPPAFVDRAFGLLSVVQARYDEPDMHWRNGVTWQDICGLASTTYDPCAVVTGAGVVPLPPTKVANVTTPLFGATPFTVFAEVDCSPVGYSQQEQRARAVDALTRAEPWQVERAFWTGQAAGATSVFPHLAANAAVADPSISNVQLQCAATPVSGSVVLDIVEGLGRLEQAAANCYNGQVTLHIPLILGQDLSDHFLVEPNGGQMKTRTGSLVSLGGGYTGSGPDGTLTPNVAWIYATGPVFAYRSQPETFNFREMLDRTTNTLKTIVERTYVLGYSCCCLLAVPISVGGYSTGLPGSAV